MVSAKNEPTVKSKGNIGAMAGLMGVRQLLNDDQYEAFCNLVPDGESLWVAFKEKRDESPIEGYEFSHYAMGVLIENKIIDPIAVMNGA
jgi:hypothetical protein